MTDENATPQSPDAALAAALRVAADWLDGNGGDHGAIDTLDAEADRLEAVADRLETVATGDRVEAPDLSRVVGPDDVAVNRALVEHATSMLDASWGDRGGIVRDLRKALS